MITCHECAKLNPEHKELGDHWICSDCREKPNRKEEDKK